MRYGTLFFAIDFNRSDNIEGVTGTSGGSIGLESVRCRLAANTGAGNLDIAGIV